VTVQAVGVPAAALERVLALLPVHVRARDEAATDPLLRALLTAVAGELAVLEEDLDELYASWFVETCPEWVVPYLGDLVGVTDLPPELGTGGGAAAGSGAAASRRAVVANTVAYRRRKGTAAVIEQVARDVSGWPARAVEYLRLLATSTHVNHVRLDRPASASLRRAATLELGSPAIARGALDRLAHTPETRRIASGRGRHGVPNVGVFLFSMQVYDAAFAPARATPDGWSVHPLGYPTPLFAPPATEEAVERTAEEADLPVPLRPRRLLDLLRAARAGPAVELPVAVRVEGGDPLPPERLRVCGLEDLAADAAGAPLDGWQVLVDAVAGRLHPYLGGAPGTPGELQVAHAYGGTADVGAGTYDRSEVHAAVVDGGPATLAQVAVHAGDPSDGLANPLAKALQDAEQAWARPVDPPLGGAYVVAVADSASYIGALAVGVPAATRLIVVAADWRARVRGDGEVLDPVPGVYSPEGLRPHLLGDLTVTAGPGASVVLDGLVVEGDVVVAAGELAELVVSQCTVAGRIRVQGDAGGPNRGLTVSLVRTVAAGVDLAPTVPALLLRDCALDAALDGGVAPTIRGAGAHLTADGSTVRGRVQVRSLDASSCVLDGTVVVEHRQTGCIRFSYVGPGSRVPRRFRCVPASDTAAAPAPVYAADDPGSPAWLALAPGCPAVIAQGGEGGSEMGVHHHLRRPLRASAARRLLDPYVPVGLEIGMVWS
jgi:Phage tail protein (Tail_P2_I)